MSTPNFLLDPTTALNARLLRVAARERRLRLYCKIAACWAVWGLVAVGLRILVRQTGWSIPFAGPAVGILAILNALVLWRRQGREKPDLRRIALRVEALFPELDGRLVTAAQLERKPGEEPDYLQQRVVREALTASDRNDWFEIVPAWRLAASTLASALALLILGISLWRLPPHPKGHKAFAFTRNQASGVTVNPGDVAIERGNSLVVLARFGGNLPSTVDLVLTDPAGTTQRIPLAKSLADPVFGGSVPEVATDLAYHVEYSGDRTKDFHVKVFEYPRLDRSDVNIAYPDYTGLQPKRIEDTRRLSAVEGSKVDLNLQLNKPVASARLIAKGKTRLTLPKGEGQGEGEHDARQSTVREQEISDVIPLSVQTNRAVADLTQFPLMASKTYELQLVDAEGRTNKVPAQFVFEALTNRTPEFHLASPRGDIRPSPLEEIPFEGTVWDDFGVKKYGIGYTIPGKETAFIELGSNAPAKEKKEFQHVLHLENLGVQPDELVAWFLWADDVGPDGQLRRSTGDLYFGEVRPFEEVFREGQGMESQGGQQQGGQQDRTGKLADLQKQIMNATWNLQRNSLKQKPDAPRKSPKSSSLGAPKPSLLSSSPSIRLPRHSNVFGLALAGDPPDDSSPSTSNTRPSPPRRPASGSAPTYEEDATVVRDSQEDALKQAEAASRRQQDARTAALWSAAKKEMETALARLEKATNSPASLPDALAAEQAAYQALLKLQQHEYQVQRNRNRSQGGGSSRNQQMQRQLDEMDLTQSENRYETQRQAQRPQDNQRREQLQVQNRLQELARRQQDLNDRLKEMQTALQEAKTEQEREEIRRRLKRLQEEEQQMLADVDELRQRMEKPDNQSQMSDERRQLDDTRDDIQRAAQAASQGSASQALASGTRAQRQLQDLRDQVRKQNSGQFSDEMREMRSEARELARQQEELSKKMENEGDNGQKSLSGSPDRKAALDQLAQQKARMTNLVDRATQLSQQAEEAEPLLSRQLYDTVRKFAQDTSKDVREMQDELLNRGLMTRSLYDRLKESSEPDGAKMMDITSELLREDFLKQAAQSGQRSRASIENLKQGVERAAEGVLGDDTEALRMAQQELDRLTSELQKEMAGTGGTNQAGRASPRAGQTGEMTSRTNSPGQGSESQELAQNNAGRRGNSGTNQTSGEAQSQAVRRGQAGQTNSASQASGERSGQNQEQAQNDSQNSNDQTPSNSGQQQGDSNSSNQGQQSGQSGQSAANGDNQNQNGGQRQLAQGERNGGRRGGSRRDGGRTAAAGGDEGGDSSGSLGRDWDRVFNEESAPLTGPITGDDFGPWSDRLRDVEEMVDTPDLRNSIAVARERARLARQEFKRDLKKPDWAVVQLQVMKPLLEVRDRITDELARRQSSDALVPIDRDPVPTRYSDLVRRYYEELGKDR